MQEEEEYKNQKQFSLIDFFRNSPLTQLITYLILAMFIFIVYIAHAVGLVFSLKCEHYFWFSLITQSTLGYNGIISVILS